MKTKSIKWWYAGASTIPVEYPLNWVIKFSRVPQMASMFSPQILPAFVMLK